MGMTVMNLNASQIRRVWRYQRGKGRTI